MLYGVFEWRGDGRYSPEGGYVVRSSDYVLTRGVEIINGRIRLTMACPCTLPGTNNNPGCPYHGHAAA